MNIALNALLIQGQLGFPAMGLQGAGVATLISRCVVALVLWGWMIKAPSMAQWMRGETLAKIQRPIFTALLQLGTPVAFQHLLEMGVFALGAFMMGWIHADALAAHQIAFTCASTSR